MTEKGLSAGSAVDLGVHCGEGDAGLVSWCRKNSRGSVSSRGPVQMQVGHLFTASDCTEAS